SFTRWQLASFPRRVPPDQSVHRVATSAGVFEQAHVAQVVKAASDPLAVLVRQRSGESGRVLSVNGPARMHPEQREDPLLFVRQTEVGQLEGGIDRFILGSDV